MPKEALEPGTPKWLVDVLMMIGRRGDLHAAKLTAKAFTEVLRHPSIRSTHPDPKATPDEVAKRFVDRIQIEIDGIPDPVDHLVAQAALASDDDFRGKTITDRISLLRDKGIGTDAFNDRRPIVLMRIALNILNDPSSTADDRNTKGEATRLSQPRTDVASSDLHGMRHQLWPLAAAMAHLSDTLYNFLYILNLDKIAAEEPDLPDKPPAINVDEALAEEALYHYARVASMAEELGKAGYLYVDSLPRDLEMLVLEITALSTRPFRSNLMPVIRIAVRRSVDEDVDGFLEELSKAGHRVPVDQEWRRWLLSCRMSHGKTGGPCYPHGMAQFADDFNVGVQRLLAPEREPTMTPHKALRLINPPFE